MRYLVIGLGIYGANLARDLTAMGHEVVGADIKRSHVDAIKDDIATSYVIDSTEPASVDVLPLKAVDTVIVAIGENFGASVRTVAILKKAGVKRIYARAIDEMHYAILESFGVDRILTPEQDAARFLTDELTLGSEVTSLRLTDDSYAMRFEVPGFFVGMAYSKLDWRKRFGLTIVAATRAQEFTNCLGCKSTKRVMLDLADESLVVEAGDAIACIGAASGLKALHRHIA